MERKLAYFLGGITLCSGKLRDVPYYYVKGHYLFINAAMACVLPFIHVYGQDRGISAMNIGFIFSLLPFLSMVAKPFVGWIVDCKKQLKCIMVVLLCQIMLGCIMLIFVPAKPLGEGGLIKCTSSGTTFHYENEATTDCLNTIPNNRNLSCTLSCHECPIGIDFSKWTERNVSYDVFCESKPELNGKMELQFDNGTEPGVFNVTSVSFGKRLNMNTACMSKLYFHCHTVCSRVMHKCFMSDSKPTDTRLQFWLFFVSATFIYISFGILSSLSDVACFNVLGEHADLYSRQRLWGTIGWALSCPFASALNYVATQKDSAQYALYQGPVFNFGFALAFFFFFFDVSFVKSLKIDNLTISRTILRDVGRLLMEARVLMFLLSVFVIGTLTGIMWSFLFLYLMNLNAPSVLIGMVTIIQCLIGELPVFIFAGIIISKIGHFNSLTVSFVAFGCRFIAYSYLENPWCVLPIEILQGPTYGLFYTTMATYANVAAPPGTEATMQGLCGGTFEGLGVAVGSLVGGYVMQTYGGDILYFWAGILAFSYVIVNIFFTVFVRWKTKKAPMMGPEQNVAGAPSEQDAFI